MIKGTCIHWDEARGLLYFTNRPEPIFYDSETGEFIDSSGGLVSLSAIESATVTDQALLDEVLASTVQGRQGQFVPFKGFNEEADWRLVSLDFPEEK